MRKYLLLLLLLSAACRPAAGELNGRLLLWHEWDETEAEVLEEMLDSFSQIYPNVRVIAVAVPPGDISERFQETASLGLGPDMIIASSKEMPTLVEAGLIRDISSHTINEDKYLSSALQTLRIRDKLYGLPLALRPLGLYYNTELVETPAQTLNDLLDQATDGKGVALNTHFVEALWGLQAFGGRLFDEDGRVVLDQGGFTNWLSWLKSAQDVSGMILDRNDDTLRDLFVSAKVAYYIAGPQALTDLQTDMGIDRVGAAELPTGPNGPAGPLLEVETLFFNDASAGRQVDIAIELADYLTNAEQSTVLMRRTNRVPANRRVRVDQQTFPVLAEFAAGARTAVATPTLPQMQSLIDMGEEMLRGVLSGVVDVTAAVDQLVQDVNSQYSFTTLSSSSFIDSCDASGTLRIWHPWSGTAESVLTDIATDFMAGCPDTLIQVRRVDASELQTRLADGNDANLSPDLIIAPSEWLVELATANLIVPLTDRVDGAILQRYVPAAQSALRYSGELYGLPISLDLVAMYYNANQIDDPPTILDDLLNEAAAGHKVGLPTDFELAYWGVSAFGGTLLDSNQRLTLVETGFSEWLIWLREAQDVPGMLLSQDPAILQALFTSEAVAYYAGPSSDLAALQAVLGVETVQVAPLPNGPAGAAGPRLTVDAFFLNAGTLTPETTALGLTFATFATNVENQSKLMREAQRVPANVNVETDVLTAIDGFMTQAQTAVVWPNVVEVQTVLAQGNGVYEEVVARRGEAAAAVCAFEASVNEINGVAPPRDQLPPLCLDGPPSTTAVTPTP